MRTTVDLDEELLARAQAIVNAPTKRALLEAGLRALVDQEARRRAVSLAGSMPDIEPPPRRRGAEEP